MSQWEKYTNSLQILNNYSAVQKAVYNCLELLGGISFFIKPRDKALIKPNILQTKDLEELVTTHPVVDKAVINAVKSVNVILMIEDSPGGTVRKDLKEYWKVTSIAEVCEHLEVEMVNFETLKVYLKGRKDRDYHIAKNLF